MSETLVSPDARPRSDVRPKGTSFPGLVGVELRRLWWRRLTKAALVAVVIFTGASVYNAYSASDWPSSSTSGRSWSSRRLG